MAGAAMHGPAARPGEAAPKLDRSGIVRVATIFAFLVLQASAFFAAAGSLARTRGWLYFGGLGLYTAASMVVLAARFPRALEIVNQRGKVTRGVKAWDRAVAGAYALLVVAAPLVVGLDVRAGASRISAAWFVPAMAATLAALALAQWAMVVNPFAETGVRVQRERGHVVVSSGPHRWVRHPLYGGKDVDVVRCGFQRAS